MLSWQSTRRRKEKKIVVCCDDKEISAINIPSVDRHLKSHGGLVYGYAKQKLYCFDSDLKDVWTEELDAEVISTYIEVNTSDERSAILIVYFGSDDPYRQYRTVN